MAKLVPSVGFPEEREEIKEIDNKFSEFFFENSADSRPPDDFEDNNDEPEVVEAEPEILIIDDFPNIEPQPLQGLPVPEIDIFVPAPHETPPQAHVVPNVQLLSPVFSVQNQNLTPQPLATPNPVIVSPRFLPPARKIDFRPFE